jgi:hypothetical protein
MEKERNILEKSQSTFTKRIGNTTFKVKVQYEQALEKVKQYQAQMKRLKQQQKAEEQVHRHANNRHGVWFCNGLQYLNYAMNNKKLRELGYPTFTEFYVKVCEN